MKIVLLLFYVVYLMEESVTQPLHTECHDQPDLPSCVGFTEENCLNFIIRPDLLRDCPNLCIPCSTSTSTSVTSITTQSDTTLSQSSITSTRTTRSITAVSATKSETSTTTSSSFTTSSFSTSSVTTSSLTTESETVTQSITFTTGTTTTQTTRTSLTMTTSTRTSLTTTTQTSLTTATQSSTSISTTTLSTTSVSTSSSTDTKTIFEQHEQQQLCNGRPDPPECFGEDILKSYCHADETAACMQIHCPASCGTCVSTTSSSTTTDTATTKSSTTTTSSFSTDTSTITTITSSTASSSSLTSTTRSTSSKTSTTTITTMTSSTSSTPTDTYSSATSSTDTRPDCERLDAAGCEDQTRLDYLCTTYPVFASFCPNTCGICNPRYLPTKTTTTTATTSTSSSTILLCEDDEVCETFDILLCDIVDPFLEYMQHSLCPRMCGHCPSSTTGSSTSTSVPACNKPLDLLFLLDTSDATWAVDAIPFVKNTITAAAQQDMYVGVATFASKATIEFFVSLDENNVTSVLDALDEVQYATGLSSLEAGLLTVREFFALSSRLDAKQVVVVVTDGAPNLDSIPPTAAANSLHNDGVSVVAVGVGSTVESVLSVIASQPKYILQVGQEYMLNTLLYTLSIDTCPSTSSTTTATAAPDCPFDVVFLVDRSGSIGRTSFRQEVIPFVRSVVANIYTQSTTRDVRVSIITFADIATVVMDLSTVRTIEEIDAIISHMAYSGGNTNTQDGLETVLDVLVNSGRKQNDVPATVLVMTDAEPTVGHNPPKAAAFALHSYDAKVFAMGIGDRIDSSLLQMIATQNDYYFSIDKPEDLAYITNSTALMLRESVCPSSTSSTTSTTTPRIPKCDVDIDVVLLLDASTSIGSTDWRLNTIAFAKSIAYTVMQKNTSRLAVVTFATSATVEFQLDTYTNLVDVLEALDNVVYAGGETNSESGLQKALEVLSLSPRAGAKQVVVVVTDGAPNRGSIPPTAAANALHNAGVSVVAVGVGSTVESVLSIIASQPSYILQVAQYAQLQTLLESISQAVCSSNACPQDNQAYYLGKTCETSFTCQNGTRRDGDNAGSSCKCSQRGDECLLCTWTSDSPETHANCQACAQGQGLYLDVTEGDCIDSLTCLQRGMFPLNGTDTCELTP
eukprot:m.32956 g.32956  ORF g.32956 m.32956 type:complete len:1140 (+) comp8472_c0_seq1:388-3807(+)